MHGAFFKTAVAKDLQIDQTQANAPAPQHKKRGQQIKSGVGAVAGCIGSHGSRPLDKHGGLPSHGKPPGTGPRICTDIHGFSFLPESVFIRVNPWRILLDGRDARPSLPQGRETTETEALAITGAVPSGAADSIRITCPAWGGCIPYCRASRSIRSG